jgi:uncharacterized protein
LKVAACSLDGSLQETAVFFLEKLFLPAYISLKANLNDHHPNIARKKGKSLLLFKQWIGLWTLKRLPELTKEEIVELNKIRERY